MILERLLPEDVTAELARLMDKKYAASMKARKFSITSRRDMDRVSVTVLLSDSSSNFYYPVEGRVDITEEDMTAEAAAFFLIDYIDLYFEEYFQDDENTYLPLDWTKFNYEAVDFELKGQVLNKRVDQMADKLLAEAALLDTDNTQAVYPN